MGDIKKELANGIGFILTPCYPSIRISHSLLFLSAFGLQRDITSYLDHSEEPALFCLRRVKCYFLSVVSRSDLYASVPFLTVRKCRSIKPISPPFLFLEGCLPLHSMLLCASGETIPQQFQE